MPNDLTVIFTVELLLLLEEAFFSALACCSQVVYLAMSPPAALNSWQPALRWTTIGDIHSIH